MFRMAWSGVSESKQGKEGMHMGGQWPCSRESENEQVEECIHMGRE